MHTANIRVEVVSPEEAADGTAEFWLGAELLAITTIWEGQLHLRVEPRHDGQPWLVETSSLVAGLAEANRLIAQF